MLLASRLSIVGYSPAEIGVLIAVACAGSVAGTIVMALFADRMGRRLALIVSAVLMAAAGAVFATCDSYPLLLAAAFIGTVSPSTNDNTPFGMNLLAAAAQLAAPALTARSGLLVTMLWPHAVSNVLLLGVAFAPTFPLAAALLLVRHALSKIDVPARQAFTAAIVAPPQRTAVASMTAAARGVAVSTSPLAATVLSIPPLAEFGTPLVAAALLALLYDALMLRAFGPAPWGRRSGAVLPPTLPVDRAALLHGHKQAAASREGARR
ncbi:hypothetical protein [Catellatospora vulcania]|uniref:hypothetical protein n=1 Tax=Catellatospora vulcania TaxID=1460450 RepID=UPI0012D485BE|nr:hypothetical protein [Catellatospora vulcania]